MQDNYRIQLLIQRKNIENSPPLHAYFSNVYKQIGSEIENFNPVLEIGAGAGISEIFLTQKILRTDFFSFPEYGVRGDCPAEELPYQNSTFEAIIMIDALHHISNLDQAFNEFIRVMKPGGKIVIFEPWVSVLSFLPYKLFHHESTSWKHRPSRRQTLNDPSHGDQGVSRYIILDESFGAKFATRIRITRLEFMSPVTFYLTGGVSSPSHFSEKLLKKLIMIEKKIPQCLMKLIAARVMMSFEVL